MKQEVNSVHDSNLNNVNIQIAIFKSIWGHWILWGIVIILLIFLLITQIPAIYNYNHVALILGFVGVLATFIVISNYWQVVRIEKDFRNQVLKIEINFNEQIKELKSIEKKVNNIEKQIITSAPTVVDFVTSINTLAKEVEKIKNKNN